MAGKVTLGDKRYSWGRQALGWAILALFVAGFFWDSVGMWTGPVLAVWFIGTQRIRRGFEWMMLLTLVPMVMGHWRMIATGPGMLGALAALGWMAAASLVLTAPLAFHRLASSRLPGLVWTLPLPAAGVAAKMAALRWLPAAATGLAYRETEPNWLLRAIANNFGTAAVTFLALWFAAVVVWMWNREAPAWKYAITTVAFVGGMWGAAWAGNLLNVNAGEATRVLGWTCGAVTVALSAWAAVAAAARKRRSWTERSETVMLLRSPSSGEPLYVVRENGKENLVSASGERFAIRDGMPVFLTAEDLSGANGKYNRLYETIAGFYDDSQRVFTALAGMDRDQYVRSYLGSLEAKPGDRVLETSVGTGLNFRYLPRGIHRYGLDLSPEMLVNCQTNMQRWGMDGDLFVGNAERLPFADESFDVVFHTGGINFFSDRAKAIREMIRVAKPGSLILIADETEEHVKGAYEHIPYTREFYKDREEKVSAPVELIPAEMEEVHAETVWRNRFYALTFRKPGLAPFDSGRSSRPALRAGSEAEALRAAEVGPKA